MGLLIYNYYIGYYSGQGGLMKTESKRSAVAFFKASIIVAGMAGVMHFFGPGIGLLGAACIIPGGIKWIMD